MSKLYRVTWKLEFEATDDAEARANHMAALKAMDEAPEHMAVILPIGQHKAIVAAIDDTEIEETDAP